MTATMTSAAADDTTMDGTAMTDSSVTDSTPDDTAIAEIEGLNVRFGPAHVLHDVDLQVRQGRTVGLVGESGSGKSTLAKVLVGVVRPSAGTVRVAGMDVHRLRGKEHFAFRRRVQMIPQDPFSSLDPRLTVGESLAEAIDPGRATVRRHHDRIEEALERVKLPGVAGRYPHEFSGGQRQRIAIARALAVRPEFIIADEITSALDVSVQAQVLDLIAELRDELRLTMIFISHNLAVVQEVSDEVAVMSRGWIVEHDTADNVYGRPAHPYTRLLLDSVPGCPGFTLDDQ